MGLDWIRLDGERFWVSWGGNVAGPHKDCISETPQRLALLVWRVAFRAQSLKLPPTL